MKKNSDNLLSRRDTLRLLGAAGATAFVGGADKNVLGLLPTTNLSATAEAASAVPNLLSTSNIINPAIFAAAPRVKMDIDQLSCVTKPALTEGPFFVDEKLNRADIRSDPSNNTVKAGTLLKVKFYVSRVSGSTCTPLVGAWVDLWHCDSSGGYSDVSGQGNPNNLGQKFLRGYQVTDANGSVEFTTIYPGWYSGRTVHMHYKVRLFNGTTQTYEFTSQLCFDDTLTDQVFTQTPYNTRGTRNTRNSNDNIYQSGGTAILLSLTSDGAGGYTSTYSLGLSGVPASVASVAAVSAATFASGSLATEAIAALFGTGLASGTVSATMTPLPTTLGDAQVQVRDSAGTTRNAPLFYVSPTQINFQIPAGSSAGAATISVLLNGSTVGQGTATIASVAPGLFTANATGKGVPAAVILRVKADGTQTYESLAQYDQTQSAYVATPIDLGASTDQVFLIGYGTGIRNRSALTAVGATIGGTAAVVSYAGASSGFVGLDQVNILIPRSLASRGSVDVVLGVDSSTANTVTINVK